MNKEEKLKNILEELQDAIDYPRVLFPTMDGTDEEEMDNDKYLEVENCKILLDYIKQLEEMIDEQDGCNKRRLQIFDLKNKLCKELKNVKNLKQENKALKKEVEMCDKKIDNLRLSRDKAIKEIDTTPILLPTEYGDEFASFKRKLRKILKGE